MTEPDGLVLVILREMRSDVSGIRDKMATKEDIADVRSEMRSLRADVASDLAGLEKRLSDQEKRLSEDRRSSPRRYGISFVRDRHGVLISEFEERLRRVEQHLNLPPPDPH